MTADARPTGFRDRGVDGDLNDVGPGRLVDRPVASLRPVRRYLELRRAAVPPGAGECPKPTAMCAPLLVTTRGTILDGYARWQAAVERGQSNLLCLEVDLTDEEATVFILEHQRTSSNLNGYCRILLALPLEGFFRRRDRGLRSKVGTPPSSKLTNIRRTDVRIDIARVAGVSTGNVSKVKQLRVSVIPAIERDLRRGTVSIHKAWQWREMSANAQRDALCAHRNRRGIRKTIRDLIAAHVSRARALPTSEQASEVLSSLATHDLRGIVFEVVDIPGPVVVISRQLYERVQKEREG